MKIPKTSIPLLPVLMLIGLLPAVPMAGDMDPATDDVPRVIPYRGVLELNGTPHTGAVNLLFVIYSAPAGANWDGDGAAPGDVLWFSEKPVDVVAGRFNVLLGQPPDPGIGAIVAYADDIYLGLAIVERDGNGDVTRRIALGGRQAIVPMPFALWSAGSANLQVGGDLSIGGDVTATGDVTAENVTVSTTVTAQSVHVTTDLTVDGSVDVVGDVTAHNLGSLYVRWGRTVCPGAAELVYAGYAAGSHYQNAGNGANTLCLHDAPTWDDYNSGDNTSSNIWGTEFETAGTVGSLAPLQNYDARCAVCYAPRRPTRMMLPGRNVCPTGWTLEYQGYLMAQRFDYPRSEYVCVDREPEFTGSPTNSDGNLWYPVEATAGSLPTCSPPCTGYVHNRELTCAVCTR